MKQTKIQILSRLIKKEANLLLKKTSLINLLKQYGDVFIRGSYELDLMIDSDIDIYVINKNLNKDLSLSALNELIRKNNFKGYIFYDFIKHQKKGFPKGYYIGLKTRFKNKKWKVDVWFMNSMDKASDKFIKKILLALDDKNRIKILKLKNLVKINKLKIASYLIYMAVIKNNIKDLNSLKLFANNK